MSGRCREPRAGARIITTIAWRDGVLAADTMIASGCVAVNGATKIVRRLDGDMAGSAGSAGYCCRFLEWFLAGEKDDPPKAEEDDVGCDVGLIFRNDLSVELFEPPGRAVIRTDYYAAGSGRGVALGAMFAGADPEQAVMAAIAHDVYTGGQVMVLRSDVG